LQNASKLKGDVSLG